MADPQTIGKYIVIFGIFIVLAGVIYYLWGDSLGWLGRLPGDIRIERENFRFYFPITTMILFSILLSFLLYLIRRLL